MTASGDDMVFGPKSWPYSNKATKSRGTLGEEVHLGKKNNIVATKCFGGLQLGAHPGDDLHDDPGAGLLEHRHR